MKLRTLRDQFFPWVTRQSLLSWINPIRRAWLSNAGVTTRLERLLQKHQIEQMDLGGWMPVEGYLTLHLSPVELYGRPSVHRSTYFQETNDGANAPRLARRALEAPAVSVSFDATKGLPLRDSTFKGINMSHFLEHFDIETGRDLLRECRRILRPGGTIRVSCPDLKKYARAYLDADDPFFSTVGSSTHCNYEALPTNGAIFAAKAYDGANGHKWFYDAETVISLLQTVGFSGCAERELHQSSLGNIESIEPKYRLVESFYVEGQTPA